MDLTNIAERGTGRSHADISWDDLPMQNGRFKGDGIEGNFYGPINEEAGGVFDRNQILGAFSARRAAP